MLDSDSNIILEMNEGVTLSGNVGVNFGVKEGVIQVKAGTLTVNSGTISNYRTGSAYSYGIVVEGTASNTANLYIKGSAKITSEYMAVYSNSYSRIEVADNAVVTGSSKQSGMFVDGELTVNGGEISGGDAIRAWGSRKNVTINGGTIKGQTTGIYVYSDDTEVEITGGYIEGKSRGVLIHSGHLNISGDAEIYGGNTGVSDYYKTTSTGTGSVTISGADISGGTFGVVIQDPDTSWEISGGNFSGLCGVYLKNGNPDISGGTIDADDCGVYVFSNSGLSLSGSPSIAGESMGDVYLLCEKDGSAEAKIHIDGVLNLSEPIGVTKCDSEDEEITYGGIFTEGWSTSGNTDAITSYFVSGDSIYRVELDGATQELCLNDKISLADAAVTVAEGPYVYNGEAHTPEVTVTLNGQPLTKDTDYTVSYSDNIGAGTATATITGTGRYGGTASAVFTIEKADPVIGDVFYDGTIYPSTPVESVTLKRDDESIPGALTLAEDSVFIEGESEYRWTFTPEDMANYNTINGTVSLTVTKDTLVKLEAEGEPDKKDYIYEDIFEVNGLTIKAVYASGYSEDVTDKVTASKLNAGDTEVILSYTDGEGTTVHCTISGITVSKRVLDNSGMRWSEETYIYDGTEQGPALNGGLPEGVKVTESGNKAADAGSYEAHAVFELAEGYSSENYALAVENLPAEWSIERRPVTVTPDSGQSKGYGQADPTLTYSADGIVEGEALSGELTRESGEDMGDYKITQGSLTDENNKNYTISFVGDVTFAILEKSITDADVSVSGAFVYNGGEHQPVPTVTMDDKVLTENVDYAVSYENNVNAGDAEIVIRGMGNYGGEVRKSFAIARKEITVTITPNGGVYNGTILPAAAAANDVIDGDDVAVTLIYTGKANDETAVDSEQYPTKAGTYTVTADSQKKVYGDKDAELTWKAEGLVGEDQLEGITVTRKAGEAVGEYPITASQSDGMNPDYDLIFVDGSLTIQARDIKDAVVELGDGLTADGKTQTQEIRQVTVQNGDGEALEVTYTVAGNQGMEPGAYTMTLTGNGNFTGTVTKTFVIAPAADSKVDTDTNGDVVIGEGTIGIRVEKDEKAPEVEIKTDQEALIEMLTENGDLTSEELSQIAQGADIRLILEVTGADGAVSEGSRVQIEKAVSGYTIGQYVNVHLFKETSREGEVLNTVQLTETRNNIKISVKVPENLLNKDASVTRTFYIVRNFDGKVEFLPTVYDEAENALIFETNKFADYAIVYKDVKNPVDDKPNGNTTTGNGKKPLNTATGTVPKTGDSMNLGLWFAVMFGACGIVIGSLVYGKRKKKRTHQVNDK